MFLDDWLSAVSIPTSTTFREQWERQRNAKYNPQLPFPSTTDLTSPLSQNATSRTGAAGTGF
jgi:hypothetical protein